MVAGPAARTRRSPDVPVPRHCESGHEKVTWRDTGREPLPCWVCGGWPTPSEQPRMQSKVRGG